MPALKARIHVLMEKPMEVSTAKCEEILTASASSSAKLMVAYWLRFELVTLATIDKVRSGELGNVQLFSSNLHSRWTRRIIERTRVPWRGR